MHERRRVAETADDSASCSRQDLALKVESAQKAAEKEKEELAAARKELERSQARGLTKQVALSAPARENRALSHLRIALRRRRGGRASSRRPRRKRE